MARQVLARIFIGCGVVVTAICLLLQAILVSAGSYSLAMTAGSVACLGFVGMLFGLGMLLPKQHPFVFSTKASTISGSINLKRAIGLGKLIFLSALVVVFMRLLLTFSYGDGLATRWVAQQAYIAFLLVLAESFVLDFWFART